MKITKIKKSFLLIILSLVSIACKTSDIPEVKNPTYQSFNEGTEKGYLVDFELSNENALPSAVVINSLEHQVLPSDKKGLVYHLRILAESRTLLGFRPKMVDKPNGILFQKDSTEIFKEVPFQLIEK
ncbi:hypothetical protein [Chryseobacterium sp. A301]